MKKESCVKTAAGIICALCLIFVQGWNSTLKAQPGTVGPESGTCVFHIVDSEGLPVPGAAVMVKGTKTGDVADQNGRCVLGGLPKDAVLVVSCLGYEDVEVSRMGRSEIKVKVRSSSLAMDEVVVVGYGTQRKKDLSGAVASVKGETIREFSNLNVASALQGRVSGVEITQLNGQPGAGMQVRIRGANSIKGSNDPLWIIDGFPGDINMINTSDIESVEVLKDASATAIYGSRGANGVVIVTTRRAKEGDVRVEYNGSAGVQNLTKQIEMLSGDEYMHYLNEKSVIQGNSPVFTEEEIAANQWNTNWQDEIFRPALITDHSINVTGGSKKMQTALGASWFSQDGIIKHGGYKRASINAKVNYNFSKYVSANANVIYTYTIHDKMDSQGGGRGSTVIGTALSASPLATPHYDDGTWNDFITQPAGGMNPVAYLSEVSTKWRSNRVLANAGITIRPFDGFSIQSSANVRSSIGRTDYFKSKLYPNYKGAASVSYGDAVEITSNNLINYDKTFKRHSINLMAGVTYEQSISKSMSSGTAENFISDVMESYDLDAAEIKGLPTSSYSEWKMLSFLGRVNYNFDNRYLLTANFRSDGSSRYSKGNKWGYFPSVAAAWRISQESFLRNTEWLSELKLRVGYGVTGSTAISPYSTQNTLESVNVVFDKTTTVGYAPKDKYLGDLKWETTAQFNTGIDFSIFQDRLSITADYYHKKTYNLLNDVEMPRSSGYTTALRNIGSIRNSGFEIQLDARLVDRAVKWDFGMNFSLNRSKILKLADGKDIFGPTISNDIIRDQLNIMREGEQMYLFYGYVEDGYDEKGAIVYKDLDEDGKITTSDKTIIGNPNPDFLMNFNTSVSFKGLTVSAFFQGSFGGDIYSMTMASLAYDYGVNVNMLREMYYNHWTEDNPAAKYPNLLSNINLKMSDRFVYDATYLRLKNLEISYAIPCKGRFLQGAKIYVSGQNLVTFTSYPLWNPDVNAKGGGSSLAQGIDASCYPIARTYTIGCRLKF
ncbi:MAG: TonB-dependent receptor [Bacteroidales bacterium]|nr:TonB-dependent receptor [Bacteroidales bacterium]